MSAAAIHPDAAGASTARGDYGFRPVGKADLPMLRAWLETAHVRRWWADPEQQESLVAAHLDDPAVDPYVVSVDGRPFAYIQTYDPHADGATGPYSDQPAATRGIDQFIGDADMVGRGHGPRFIEAMCARLFAAGAPRVITDPEPANASAVRAYQKAGFTTVDNRMTKDGPVVLMVRDRS